MARSRLRRNGAFPLSRTPRGLGCYSERLTSTAVSPLPKLHCSCWLSWSVRPAEIRLATWKEFDVDGREPQWVIPAARMKMRLSDHIVPLPPPALTILSDLRPLTDRGPDALVLQGLRPGRPLSSSSNVALRTMGFAGTEHVSHGFRSTASTLLHELSYGVRGHPDAVGACSSRGWWRVQPQSLAPSAPQADDGMGSVPRWTSC